MDLSAPRAVSSINALSKPEVGLRPFQRVTAQVLDVTGTTALLSIAGQPIVAKLTSTEQAKILLGQQTAQFIVTQLTNQKITLKMVKGTDSETTTISSSSGTELAMHLLEQNSIPPTISNLMMARSILKNHLPVTKGLLNELMEALSEYGVWGSREAEVAAVLKAAGLPVGAQSIALALRQPDKTSNSISQLIKYLNSLSDQDLPSDALRQLELNMWLLNGLILDPDEEASHLAEQLKAMLGILGRSPENILLEQAQNSETAFSEINLLTLVQLQKLLEKHGKNETAEVIGKFLEDICSYQFRNAHSEWAEINLPIQNVKTEEGFSTARLRISRDARSGFTSIDLNSTRFILQVEISSGETVEVDLSVIGRQIQAAITAPNPLWSEKAESELPSLESALENLGFSLNDAKVCVGEAQPFMELNLPSDQNILMTVDVEV